MPFQIATSPTLGEIVVFDNVPELQFAGGLNSLFCRNALPRNQADELAEEHLAVTPTEALGGLVIAPVLGALDQRIALDLDAGVLADQAPERIVDRRPTQQLEAFAGIVPQPLQVRAEALIGAAADDLPEAMREPSENCWTME